MELPVFRLTALISDCWRSNVTDYTVVQRPMHRTLGSAGRDNGRLLTTYRLNADYAGDDKFAVRLVFVPRSSQESLETIAQMRVRPEL